MTLSNSIAVACCLATMTASSQAALNTLLPLSITTISGKTSGQALSSSIAVLDSSGKSNKWNNYIEFSAKGPSRYEGFRTFKLPSAIAPSRITGLQIHVNYQGPRINDQTWTWRLFNWDAFTYVAVGNNASAPSWGTWSLLQFSVNGDFSRFVNPVNQQIRLQLVANNTYDVANIDYEAIIITTVDAAPALAPLPIPSPSPSPPLSRYAAAKPVPAPVPVSKPAPASVAKPVSVPIPSAKPPPSVAKPLPPVGKPVPVPILVTKPLPPVFVPVPVPNRLSPVTVTNKVLYVSKSGNDNHSGAINAPLRSIQRAANLAVAGNTIYVRGGVYNESVSIIHSGSETAGRIVFQNYPGEVSIVDGTGVAILDQNGLFNLVDVSYVTVKGFEVRNYVSDKASQTPAGIAVSGAGGYIEILDNKIHGIATTVNSDQGNAFGLAVHGTKAPASINNLTISGNEIYDLKTGSSESLVINGNVQSWRVINNIVHNNNNIGIDAIGFDGVAPDPSYDQARDGLISANKIYNISSYGNPAYGKRYAANGIYIDGGTRIVIENNLVYNTDIGIELASENPARKTSRIILRNNMIHSNYSSGISIGSYQLGLGTTDDCDIVNNTLYNNDTKNTGSGEIKVLYNATGNRFNNNIVYASRQNLFVNSFTGQVTDTLNLDNNLYFSASGVTNSEWVWGGKTYFGIDSFQNSSAQDTESRYANPQFVNANAANFKVLVTSPAVDGGVALGSKITGSTDLNFSPRVQGSRIDIGAYEQ